MEIPPAVWLLDFVNSAPVISHTGALYKERGEEEEQGERKDGQERRERTIVDVVYLRVFDHKVWNQSLGDLQPRWYFRHVLQGRKVTAGC